MAQSLLTRLASAKLPTILLVEDEPLIRWGLAEDLRDKGYRVIEASTASVGLAVLESGTEIDLVLTDINMPGPLDGMDLARKACAVQVKVIVMSAVLPSAAGSGTFDAFLKKPFTSEEMIAAVQTLNSVVMRSTTKRSRFRSRDV